MSDPKLAQLAVDMRAPQVVDEVQRMLKQAEPGDSAEDIIRKALRSVLRG